MVFVISRGRQSQGEAICIHDGKIEAGWLGAVVTPSRKTVGRPEDERSLVVSVLVPLRLPRRPRLRSSSVGH